MKSHKFDAISFVSGVVAVVIGLAFLIPQTPVDLIDAITSLGAWFWPALLVASAASRFLVRHRHGRRRHDQPAANEPQEVPALHLESVGRRLPQLVAIRLDVGPPSHRAPPSLGDLMRRAASVTAWTMRG